MYKLQDNSIKRLSDGASIPLADGNRDYEEYKQWLAEGGIPEPEYTAEELLAKEALEAKLLADMAKKLALDSITVTTTSGKVFDGREKDVVMMSGAIQASEILVDMENARYAAIVAPTTAQITEHNTILASYSSHQWKLHDNTVVTITLAELKEALALSMVAIGTLKLGGN